MIGLGKAGAFLDFLDNMSQPGIKKEIVDRIGTVNFSNLCTDDYLTRLKRYVAYQEPGNALKLLHMFPDDRSEIL